MVSVRLAGFLTGICRCIVGAGWVVSSAMEAVERFLLRSGRGVECSVNVSDVSLRRTRTLPRTMQFSFLFRFFLDPFIAVVVCRLVLVDVGLDVVLEFVEVEIRGVDGSSMPDD